MAVFFNIAIVFLEELILERTVAHAARGGDGRQEGRERGYYYLHRNLNDPLLHRP